MPIDPRIPLSNIGGRGSGGALLQGIGAGQGARLRRLQISKLEKDEADRQALQETYAQHAETGTLGSEAFLRDIGKISPTLSLRFQDEMVQREARKRKIQSDMIGQMREVNDFVLQKITACIELGDTPAGQACYERSKAETREYLSAAGIDTAMVDNLPEKIDLQVLNTARMQRLTTKEQLDQAWREGELQRKVAEQQALSAGRVEEARQKAEATEASRLRVAERRGLQAAERQAEAQIRAAEIEKTAAPLTGAQAKEVAELDTSLALLDDIVDVFKPAYVGQVAGRAGAVREFTGQIGDEEIELRQLVQDVKDTLLRARSGAAITQTEYNRLSRIVPNITDQPNVFKAKLRRFRRNLERLRDAKIRVATTGREALEAPVTPPSEPTLSIPAITEADITATMQSSGRSRQEVIDAFRNKGYALPEGVR